MNEVSSSEKRASTRRMGSIVAVVALAVVAALGIAPPVGAQDYATTPSCRVTPSTVAPGGTVTVVADGFQPGSTVSFSIEQVRTTRAPIGEAVADANGTATAVLTIPSDLPAGSYTITCTGVDGEGAAVAVNTVIQVVDDDGGSGGSGGNGGGGSGADDLARTGSSSGALARIAVLLVAVGAALLLATRKRAAGRSMPTA